MEKFRQKNKKTFYIKKNENFERKIPWKNFGQNQKIILYKNKQKSKISKTVVNS